MVTSVLKVKPEDDPRDVPYNPEGFHYEYVKHIVQFRSHNIIIGRLDIILASLEN